MNTPTGSNTRRSTLVTVAIGVVLVVCAVVFRDLLIAWFTGRDLTPPQAASDTSHEGTKDDAKPYSDSTLDALRSAVDAYERLRASLARDDVASIAVPARTLAEAMTAAAAPLDAASKTAFGANAAAASELASAVDLDVARSAFARVSAHLISIVGRDARLVGSRRVFECSMFEGARWFQAEGPIENPYMGRRMLACGAARDWHDGDDGSKSAASGDEIDHYTCPMHPSVHQSDPGKCPICGMDLTPVTVQQQRDGVVIIDEARRQLIGVRTAPVIEASMSRRLRVVGRVSYDESAFTDVNLKIGGWITKLHVSETGQRVARGQPLFTLYSPELYAAQQDLLLALRSSTQGEANNGAARADQLVRAARKRLSLLGLHESQIDQIAAGTEPIDAIPIPAPAAGFVIEKDVVEGAAVQAGARLFRIAALENVWIEGDVYEEDLRLVRVGQAATVILDYLPGRSYEGKVSYVYPYLESAARTGRVRIELKNKGLELRPGMYARIDLASDIGPRIQVPASAVVYTGPRRLVFVDLGEGRFKPQEIRTGIEAGGMYEVLAGLKSGDVVATSGMFLIAAEARISTAAKYWESESNSAPERMHD